MKLQLKRKKARIELVPMIDVLFFILIFFMLFASFEKAKAIGVKVDLPKALYAGQAERNSIIIEIDQEAQVFLGSEQVTLSELKQQIALELKKAPEPQFIIKPDRKVTYGEIVKLMDTLAEVGVEKPLWGVERENLSSSQ